MWLAAEPGANVILPQPGFATFSALPESLGLELRYYRTTACVGKTASASMWTRSNVSPIRRRS
jgi:hypothetical protein